MPMDEGMADRLPPHDHLAEQSVLGSMLRDNNVIGDVLQVLRDPTYFYSDAHQKLFRGIVSIYDEGRPVDTVTLLHWVNEQKYLEDIGGAAYLAELWDAAPTAANAVYYAQIVRAKGTVRKLIHAGNEILRDAYDQAMPADELLESAERRILEIAELGATGDTVTLKTALKEAFDRIDSRADRSSQTVTGVPSGFADLDNLAAGFQTSELIIIAARPSVGKTSFALGILRNVAVDYDLPVFFVSLEQSRLELAERLLCCQSRVDSQKIRKGHLSAEDLDRLLEAGDRLNSARIYIDDTPAQSMLRIAANARRLKKRHDIKLVVIDYLQLIDPDNRRDNRQEQVAAISRRLKHLARELKIPVIALAQLNRGPEDRQDHKPRLSDLRESGAIEQDADTVILLHRDDYREPGQNEGVIDLIVAKQRNGPTGSVKLAFIKKYMRFEDLATEPPFDYGV